MSVRAFNGKSTLIWGRVLSHMLIPLRIQSEVSFHYKLVDLLSASNIGIINHKPRTVYSINRLAKNYRETLKKEKME